MEGSAGRSAGGRGDWCEMTPDCTDYGYAFAKETGTDDQMK